jgi:hypothetical protein
VEMWLAISLINNKEPRMEPCVTPDITGREDYCLPSTTTCKWQIRYIAVDTLHLLYFFTFNKGDVPSLCDNYV